MSLFQNHLKQHYRYHLLIYFLVLYLYELFYFYVNIQLLRYIDINISLEFHILSIFYFYELNHIIAHLKLKVELYKYSHYLQNVKLILINWDDLILT